MRLADIEARHARDESGAGYGCDYAYPVRLETHEDRGALLEMVRELKRRLEDCRIVVRTTEVKSEVCPPACWKSGCDAARAQLAAAVDAAADGGAAVKKGRG